MCFQDNRYTLSYVLRVKPKENVAEEFIKTAPGDWDESYKVSSNIPIFNIPMQDSKFLSLVHW